MSYNGTEIKSQAGNILDVFSNLVIRNTLAPLFVLPTKIEVENFVNMVGLTIENTTDIGGGKNLGYTDTNDYADYIVYSEENASYQVNLRIASQNNAGEIGLFTVDSNNIETLLGKVTIPVTSGWQTWQTVSVNVNMPVGIQTLRMKVLKGGFNFNWMQFVQLANTGDLDGDGIPDEIDACPNTVTGATVDSNGCAIFTIPTDNFNIEAKGETCLNSNNGKIIITPKTTKNYILKINGIERKFTTGITLASLIPGAYNFCITVEGETFEQCFALKIASGIMASAKSSVFNNRATVQIEKGTAPFKVYVNGAVLFETMSSIIDVNMQNGDVLLIETAVACEGIISKKVEIKPSIIAYPNPSSGVFEIDLPISDTQIKIEVYTVFGQLVTTNYQQSTTGNVQVDLSNKPTGLYMVKVYLDKPITLKLIKK